ncbi:MAG: hypothetical protein Q7T34_00805 [Candidatus Parcubacteria bacterium]|nr:hypothetical protein [Candidatus Parcubacteria bacterium]
MKTCWNCNAMVFSIGGDEKMVCGSCGAIEQYNHAERVRKIYKRFMEIADILQSPAPERHFAMEYCYQAIKKDLIKQIASIELLVIAAFCLASYKVRSPRDPEVVLRKVSYNIKEMKHISELTSTQEIIIRGLNTKPSFR